MGGCGQFFNQNVQADDKDHVRLNKTDYQAAMRIIELQNPVIKPSERELALPSHQGASSSNRHEGSIERELKRRRLLLHAATFATAGRNS